MHAFQGRLPKLEKRRLRERFAGGGLIIVSLSMGVRAKWKQPTPQTNKVATLETHAASALPLHYTEMACPRAHSCNGPPPCCPLVQLQARLRY
eukprot:2466599-Amphidinium_carterae.1